MSKYKGSVHTEWLRKPAKGIKQVLSFPSGNMTFMLFEYQSSQAHKNCSHVQSSGGNTSGYLLHSAGTNSSYWMRKCCEHKKIMPHSETSFLFLKFEMYTCWCKEVATDKILTATSWQQFYFTKVQTFERTIYLKNNMRSISIVRKQKLSLLNIKKRIWAAQTPTNIKGNLTQD